MNSPKCLLPDFRYLYSKIAKYNNCSTINGISYFFVNVGSVVLLIFLVLLFITSPMKNWGFPLQSGLFNKDIGSFEPVVSPSRQEHSEM
jgi:MFS-type transporter involved in bile tolerance (Atg22 family)